MQVACVTCVVVFDYTELMTQVAITTIILITGWSKKKPHKVNDTIILQPYVIESCGFQQSVPKEISYMTKVNICIQQLNILCYWR